MENSKYFGSKTFIVAELSANHGSDLGIALETVRAAKKAGADAVKLQTYTPDTITIDCLNEDFKIDKGTIWDGQYLYDLYKEAYTPWEWHGELFKAAQAEDLVCFSSPFDKTAVDFLESLNNPIYKIASLEITDIPLIRYVASKKKPVIISTGIANDDDIQLAIDTCKAEGNDEIVLLKCTTSYPAPIDKANLAMIGDFKRKFSVMTGLSDHTLGITVPIVAVTLGAKVVEKHFILDKSVGGPDASFSLDQNEFARMVSAIRDAEVAIGKIDYQLDDAQKKSREFSRSLYVVESMKRGDIVTFSNIRSIRPGYGLHPKHYNEILGKKVNKDLSRGDRFSLEFVSKDLISKSKRS